MMEDKKAIDIIKDGLINLKNKGVNDIDVTSFIKYVSDIKLYDSDRNKYNEQVHQTNLAKFESDTQRSIEMFRSVIDAGKDALRAVMIVNLRQLTQAVSL